MFIANRITSIKAIQAPLPYDEAQYGLSTIPPERSYCKSYERSTPMYNKIQQHNTLDETTLHLHTHMQLLCPETGIRCAVAFPCPVGLTLDWVHPFSYLDNVGKVIKSYQRHSTPFIDIPIDCIAGMLITVMKQKNWAYCRDNIKANERLQQCNKKVLIYCLDYFYKNQPRIQGVTKLPSFNLLSDGNITQQLIGFIKICKGEDTTIEVQHLIENKTRKITAVIHTDKQKQETAYLVQAQREFKVLLDTLKKQKPNTSPQIFESINRQLRSIATMSESAKYSLCGRLNDVFGENEITKRISYIILTTKTDHIDNDLLTFSMEIQRERDAFVKNKQSLKEQMNAILGAKK